MIKNIMPRKGKSSSATKTSEADGIPQDIGTVDTQEMPGMPGMPGMPPGFPGLGNMDQLVSMAQKIAENVTKDNKNQPIDPKNLDMSKILSQVSGEVSKMVTPDFINNMNNNSMANDDRQIPTSKVSLTNSKIEELNESEDEDNNITPLSPRTKDLNFTLNVTLEELYNGKTKKLAVRRKRIVDDDKGGKKIVEEKKKLAVVIEPGMYDEQVITFNKQADEKEGYETGDIIITLSCSEHNKFTRDGNNLVLEQDISLYEMFKPEFTIEFINGKMINVSGTPINIFGDELESFRKLSNFGMPIINGEKPFGDLLIQFKPVLPPSISEENLELLKQIFPPVNNLNTEIDEVNQLELVTESDFEFSDDEDESDSDSEESDSEENSESEEESDSEESD